MKFSRADSRVKRFIKSDVSETDSASIVITALMTRTESVSETSDLINLPEKTSLNFSP